MKILHLLFISVFSMLSFYASANQEDLELDVAPKKLNSLKKNIVVETKRIILNEFPNAFNPSIIEADFGYLLTFRYCPLKPYDVVSYLGIVRLDHNFNPISPAQLIDTRFGNHQVPAQSEDARLFSLNGKLYIIYNDNPDVIMPSIFDRRDLYLAELYVSDGNYYLSYPLKLKHADKYSSILWQKNWVPFVSNGKLYFSYSIYGHEVLEANVETGICSTVHHTTMDYQWKFGSLRGGTPGILIGGKYYSFFHSSMYMTSYASKGKEMIHYLMGAYTFSAEPPYEILEITPAPIECRGFYTRSECDKRVIFPCGIIDAGDVIYVTYGKDDREMWVATIEKNKLDKCLIRASQ
jgi:predicted GH43/DUF377 family glycosyl hydrolase